MGTGVWNKQIGGWYPDDEPETSEYEVSILISASIEAQDEEEAKEIFWDEMKHYASMSDIEIYE